MTNASHATTGDSPFAAPMNRSGDPWEVVACDAARWGVLEIAGPDAKTFLQGQLSSDVAALVPGKGGWTSYNSPKGRMLANGFVWQFPAAERYGFALSADIAEPVRKRLAMFVLRSKVTLVDASPVMVRVGFGGPAAAAAIADLFDEAPAPGIVIERDAITIAGLPDGRFLLLIPAEHWAKARERLFVRTTMNDAIAWERLGIRAGVGLVSTATQDTFVPQAANWDLLGGIDFRKGCYTGQEIVARTQHLGRIKERLFAFAVHVAPPPTGARLYAAVFGEQACGTVVCAAPSIAGGSELLAVVQLAAVLEGDLHLQSASGPSLAALPLPYAVRDAATPPGRIA